VAIPSGIAVTNATSASCANQNSLAYPK
jgi:hypothetical protein